MAIQHETFLRQAIDLAVDNVRQGVGGPFGALVVKDGEVIATDAPQDIRGNKAVQEAYLGTEDHAHA